MDAFIGCWKLVSKENFIEYLTALGVEEEHVQIGQIVTPTLTIYSDEEYIVFKTKTSIYSGEIRFKLGEEFSEVTRDHRSCKTVVTLEGNKLVQVQKWDGKETTFVREIRGENMIMTLTFEDAVGTLTYEKA